MYVVSLFSRTLDVHHPQPLVGSSDYVTQFVHQHTHVGTAAFCFRSSPVHPERAVPHTGTSTSSTNAVALLTAAHRPCIRVRCRKLLLLQLPCVVCTCNTQKYTYLYVRMYDTAGTRVDEGRQFYFQTGQARSTLPNDGQHGKALLKLPRPHSPTPAIDGVKRVTGTPATSPIRGTAVCMRTQRRIFSPDPWSSRSQIFRLPKRCFEILSASSCRCHSSFVPPARAHNQSVDIDIVGCRRLCSSSLKTTCQQHRGTGSDAVTRTELFLMHEIKAM